jgi:iron complex outermembrane receptor protein
LRADLFEVDTLDRCALHDTVLNSATPVQDELCYERDRTGVRDPSSRRSAGGMLLQPRGTLTVGPFEGLRFTAALGRGARAADPSYLGDGDNAPFSSIIAADAGVAWNGQLAGVQLDARAAYYYTHVGRDLIFNQQEGRNTLAPGTVRQGALFTLRARSEIFDVSGSATYAHARFQRDASLPADTYRPADAGDRVPYIPPWVLRLDAAANHRLGDLRVAHVPVLVHGGLGISYISPRALLFGEQGHAVFVTDATCAVTLSVFELGVSVQNLFDSHYRLSEYNYVSDFRSNPAAANLLPVRHFSAGAPRTFLFTLTLHWDGPGDADVPSAGVKEAS